MRNHIPHKIKMLAVSALMILFFSMSACAYTRVTATTNINVRKGPGLNYSIISSMSKGDSARRLGRSGDWIKVRVHSKTGYVYRQFVKTNVKVRYCTVSALNVRRHPSTSSNAIGSLSYGQRIRVLSISNGWAKIRYGSKYGYVSTDYISKRKPSGKHTSSSTKIRYCTASRLNIRRHPSTSSSVIGSIAYGKSCRVIKVFGQWAKIKHGNGHGYVAAEYLTASKPSGSSKSKIVSIAKSKLGCRYRYGAEGPSIFDCSGFTMYVYSKCGISIPRTSASQYYCCRKIKKSNLRSGDLIFFDTSENRNGKVSHVAIYIGNGRIIHAANSKDGVCIDYLNSRYYTSRYIGCGRYSKH